METAHPILGLTLKNTWHHKALDYTLEETMTLIEWCEKYSKDLLKFGVKDDALNHGIKTLRCAYARKVHIQITPVLLNIIRSDREIEPIMDDKGKLLTYCPEDFH